MPVEKWMRKMGKLQKQAMDRDDFADYMIAVASQVVWIHHESLKAGVPTQNIHMPAEGQWYRISVEPCERPEGAPDDT